MLNHLLPPGQKKTLMEHRLRDMKGRADTLDNAAQVEIDELRARQHDARTKSLAKIQSAEEKIRSAKQAVRQAVEHHNWCHAELSSIQSLYEKGISAMEEEKRERRSEKDAEIQAYQESIDKLDQQIMAHEASSTQDSA